MQIETRTIPTTFKTEGKRVTGRAIVFDTPTVIQERARTFTETVKPGSVKLAPDLRLLWSHDPGNVLGNTASGTLSVRVEQDGVYFDADLPESATREREAIARGDVCSMSFGFAVNKDKWQGKSRELLDIDVREISFVAFPAYPNTSANLRSTNLLRQTLAEKTLL